MNIDKILLEFDEGNFFSSLLMEAMDLDNANGTITMSADEQRKHGQFIADQITKGKIKIKQHLIKAIIKAIITEYKSLMESYKQLIDDTAGFHDKAVSSGYKIALQDQIANIDKKIINLENKLK